MQDKSSSVHVSDPNLQAADVQQHLFGTLVQQEFVNAHKSMLALKKLLRLQVLTLLHCHRSNNSKKEQSVLL